MRNVVSNLYHMGHLNNNKKFLYNIGSVHLIPNVKYEFWCKYRESFLYFKMVFDKLAKKTLKWTYFNETMLLGSFISIFKLIKILIFKQLFKNQVQQMDMKFRISWLHKSYHFIFQQSCTAISRFNRNIISWTKLMASYTCSIRNNGYLLYSPHVKVLWPGRLVWFQEDGVKKTIHLYSSTMCNFKLKNEKSWALLFNCSFLPSWLFFSPGFYQEWR